LYVPSTLRWRQHGADVALTQESLYPFEPTVRYQLKISRPTLFTLHFRIPAWADGASISINGRSKTTAAVAGSFAAVRREWKKGDRIDLDLPMSARLEPIDAQHPDTVALCFGPLALFALTESQRELTRRDLLGAQKVARHVWQISAGSGPITMLPFTAIAEQQYSTYLRVT
jgi:DUF1680 family protein